MRCGFHWRTAEGITLRCLNPEQDHLEDHANGASWVKVGYEGAVNGYYGNPTNIAKAG